MAKKKATNKTTRAASRRKVAKTTSKRAGSTRKVARSTAKRSTKKSSAKPATARKTTTPRSRKTASVKKVAARKEPPTAKAKSTATKTGATRTQTSTRRRKSTPTKARSPMRSRAAGPPAGAVPDADGYVYIRGRRVRMISTTKKPAANRKTRPETQVAEEPEVQTPNTKPIKTKLTKKELTHFRALLLQKRAELVGDLSAMENAALRSGGGSLSTMPIHMADIGTDTFDQDFMLGLAEAERLRLREIDDALQRIEARTYGVCQMTDKPIPKARLNAKPWAKYTIEAARDVERGLGE